MALLIQLGRLTQLQNRNRQQQKPDTKNSLSAVKAASILLSLKKSLYLGGTQTLSLEKNQLLDRAELIFTARVDSSSELLYRFWRTQAGNIKSRIALFQKGYYLRPRSSEIKINISKTIAYINSMAKKSQVFLLVGSRSAQFQFINGYYMGCDQQKQIIMANLKCLIGQCLYFAKTFSSLLLYKSNIINKHAVNLSSNQQMRACFTAQNGQFANLSTIHQYLSLSNCKVSNSMKQIKSPNFYEKDYNLNLNRIIDLYNNRVYPHEIILYSQARLFRKARKFKTGSDEIMDLMYNYKPTQCSKFDNNYIFSTISIQDLDNLNKKQLCIPQGAKVKILYFRAKIKYGLTSPKIDAYQTSSSGDEQIPAQLQITQNQLAPADSKPIDKALVIKIPNNALVPQLRNKVLDTIKYEKMVLQVLRTAECIYIPKYYQTAQTKCEFRDMVMMDFVPGATLADFLSAKNVTTTLAWKLHFLMHLANGVRFLQLYDIAHLDLSVNNIILTSQGIPKIIDFGDVYHQQVLKKMLKQKNAKALRHTPGRTFPSAPPETTQRAWNFNSKQDIYSIGVIAFRLIMGYFPITCPERKLEQIYSKNTYNDRLFLSPEGLEWVGQYEFILSCMQLIINCMHINQNMRPNPSWAHILFKKMFELLETFN